MWKDRLCKTRKTQVYKVSESCEEESGPLNSQERRRRIKLKRVCLEGLMVQKRNSEI